MSSYSHREIAVWPTWSEHLLYRPSEHERAASIFISCYLAADQWKRNNSVVLRRQNSARRNVICRNIVAKYRLIIQKYFSKSLPNRRFLMCFHSDRYVPLKHRQTARIPHLSDVNLDSRWPTLITRWETIMYFCNYLNVNGDY